MIQVTNESDLKFNGAVVIKFSAEWCQPCKRLETILQKMEKEFESINIYSVDIDKFSQLAQKYKVLSLPTMIFLNDSEELNRIVGVVSTDNIRKAFKALSKGE